jgi:hypothetical protein
MLRDVMRTVDPTLPRYGTDFIAAEALPALVVGRAMSAVTR